MQYDLNKNFEISLNNDQVKVEYTPEEDNSLNIVHVVFYYKDKEAEKIQNNIGIKYSKEKIELYYDGLQNFYPKCLLPFIPNIDNGYKFWIYSERNNVRMFFEYEAMNEETFYELMKQIENEFGFKDIKYY